MRYEFRETNTDLVTICGIDGEIDSCEITYSCRLNIAPFGLMMYDLCIGEFQVIIGDTWITQNSGWEVNFDLKLKSTLQITKIELFFETKTINIS